MYIPITNRRGRRDCHRMVVRFTTTFAVSAYHRYEFEPVHDEVYSYTTLCDKVCQ